MIIEEATQLGNPIIRRRCKRVTNATSTKTKQTVAHLTDSMRHHGLVGMAAPQIGESVRIFVSEIRATTVRKDEGEKQTDALRVYINPTIVSHSKKVTWGYEGCGSVAAAGLFGKVKRPYSITIEALDETGEPFQLKATGLLARVIQHEIDHINGIVFTDKADPKTFMSREEYLKFNNS